jgi:hypothetical protein
MAVLAMVKLKGDPEQILAAKSEYMDPVAEAPFREHGHQSQIVTRTDDGVIIFNLWDNPEGRDRANADPDMQAAREKIVAITGAEAEFASWEVVAQKTTLR